MYDRMCITEHYKRI